VAIDEETFHKLVRAVPSLALEVMRIMARRLRRGNRKRNPSAAPAQTKAKLAARALAVRAKVAAKKPRRPR